MSQDPPDFISLKQTVPIPHQPPPTPTQTDRPAQEPPSTKGDAQG